MVGMWFIFFGLRENNIDKNARTMDGVVPTDTILRGTTLKKSE